MKHKSISFYNNNNDKFKYKYKQQSDNFNQVKSLRVSQNYQQKNYSIRLTRREYQNSNLFQDSIILSDNKQQQKITVNTRYQQLSNNSQELYKKSTLKTFYPNSSYKKQLEIIKRKNQKLNSKQSQILEYISPKKVNVSFSINRSKKYKSKFKINQTNRLNTQQIEYNKQQEKDKNQEQNYSDPIKKYLSQQKNRKLIFDSIGTQFGLDIKQAQYNYSKQQFNQKVFGYRDKLTKKLRASVDFSKTKQKQMKCKTQVEQLFLINIRSQNGSVKKKHSNVQASFLQNNPNTIQSRYIRMRQFFQLILLSYNCVLNTPHLQNLTFIKMNKLNSSKKFLYFVGKGNNRNLIRTLMKKRWWWTQTQDINQANFVWTQLRNDSINNKKMQISQQSSNQSSCSLVKLKSYNKKDENYEIFKKIKELSSYFKIKGSQKIFHTSFLSQFSESYYSENNQLNKISPTYVHHNHFPTNYMFGNKKALFANLKEYCKFKEQNIMSMIPLTFYIQNTESNSWKLFEKHSKFHKKTLWIVKPGQNSNRGQGIFISDCVKKIKQTIRSLKSNHTYIIQKYVKNVFLFQKRKFDIRTYMLAVTFGKITKFYWYNEGYLRTSAEVYDINDFHDPMIHLTNDAIQNRGDNYGKYQNGNKISFHEFQRHLNVNYPKGKYQFCQLVKNMKQICKNVVKGTYNKLGQKQHGFQIFGLDFLVDSNFRPLLLQINTNPCLQLSSNGLQRLIPRMLDNALRIGLDPLFGVSCQCSRSFMSLISDQLIERNGFELIFDGLFDRNFEWQEKCTNNSQKVIYEDDNQEFDGDGDIIAIDNI